MRHIEALHREQATGSMDPSTDRPLLCLIADDDSGISAAIQDTLARIVPGLAFIPSARDGRETLLRIRDYRPDLFFLDLDMPRMDGITTLRALGPRLPEKTIVMARETTEGGWATWLALTLGACDVLVKRMTEPSRSPTTTTLEERLRALLVRLGVLSTGEALALRSRPADPDEIEILSTLCFLVGTDRLIDTARSLSEDLVASSLPIVVDVPHSPRFDRAICEGLDRVIRPPVRIAVDRERLVPGQVLLVPGGYRGLPVGDRESPRLHLDRAHSRSSVDPLVERIAPLLAKRRFDSTGVVFGGTLSGELAEEARRAIALRRLFRLAPDPAASRPAGESNLHRVTALIPSTSKIASGIA